MRVPPLFLRSRSYKRLFLGDRGKPHVVGRAVLADLKRFCYADRPCVVVSKQSGMVDPIASAVAEGRREVWLRLQGMLGLSEAEIVQLKEDHYE